jgi:hypothetical protein
MLLSAVSDRPDYKFHDNKRKEYAYDERNVRLQAAEQRGRLCQNVGGKARGDLNRARRHLSERKEW